MRLRLWLARIAGVVSRDNREARLDEEMRAHLDALTDAHLARGLSLEDARLAARRDFGGIDQVRERHRDQAGLPWLDALARDLALGVRRLRIEPWFSAAVVAALAIGIGGAVAVAGVVTAISWATPPFRDPAGVMTIGSIDTEGRRAFASWPDFLLWRDEARSFDDLAAFAVAVVTIADGERTTARVQGAYVSANTFALLGRPAIRGRDFVASDDRPGAAPVALIGAGLWASAFASAEDVVGRTIAVDGVATTVVGVMSPDVSFPLNGELWLPMAQRPELANGGREQRAIGVLGRLRRGITRDAALAEITALSARAEAKAPPAAHVAAARPTIESFAERFLGRSTDAVPLVLLAAAATTLLIGCATAATLLFARSAFRGDEMAMRAALGGSRRRLVQQLLAECAVLAGLAAAAGMALAWLALLRFEVELAGAGLPPWVHFRIDTRVAGIAVVAFAVAVIAGGLAPAWRLAVAGVGAVPGGGRATAARGTQRWIRGLLAAEVAFTLVLLSGAAQLITAAIALSRVDQVVDTTGIVTARLGVAGPAYARADQRAAFYERYRERLQRRGELRAAAVVSPPPFVGTPMRQVAIDGRTDTVRARHVAIDAGYLDVLGLTPIRGRGPTARDGYPGQPAVFVSARFEAVQFPAGDALGQRLRVASSPTGSPDGEWLPIVGVLPSIRQSSTPEVEPVVFVPLAAEPPAALFVMARAAAGVPVADILRDELGALDRGLALFGWQTLERWSVLSRWTQRTIGTVVGVLGTLSLTLAGLGIYSVTAYAAARRRKETSIRMAVGATPRDLLRLLVRGALWPSVVGLLVGGTGALALGPVLTSLVPRAGGGAILSLGVALVVAAVSAVAAVAPARVVANTASLESLRCD